MISFSRKPKMLSLVAASALGLAACGGSSHSTSTTASTVATTPQTTPVQTTTTATTHAAAPAKVPAVAPKKHAKYGPTVGTNEGGTARVITQIPTPLPPGITPKKSDQILACLHGTGLVQGKLDRSGVWSAMDPTTRKSVFVDGPYQTTAAADASVKTLKGLDSAARGGLFVVSAAIATHLGDAVTATASCLNGSSGAKRLTF
jgi:hypothetical protein